MKENKKKHFFKDLKTTFKSISWPKSKETFKNSGFVLSVAMLLSCFLGLYTSLITKVLSLF